MNTYQIKDTNPSNINELGTYCVKDRKSKGFKAKEKWFKEEYQNGLRLKIAFDSNGKQTGFIEFTNAEAAWRPVNADNYIDLTR